jgi:hypothetical protein
LATGGVVLGAGFDGEPGVAAGGPAFGGCCGVELAGTGVGEMDGVAPAGMTDGMTDGWAVGVASGDAVAVFFIVVARLPSVCDGDGEGVRRGSGTSPAGAGA